MKRTKNIIFLYVLGIPTFLGFTICGPRYFVTVFFMILKKKKIKIFWNFLFFYFLFIFFIFSCLFLVYSLQATEDFEYKKKFLPPKTKNGV